MRDDDVLENLKKDDFEEWNLAKANSSSENGWHEARAGVLVSERVGSNPTLEAPGFGPGSVRDSTVARGPNVSAEAGAGDGRVGAFANGELFRVSSHYPVGNGGIQGDFAINARTGIQLGTHNEIKVLGTGIEVGKDGIGASIFGMGFRFKPW